MFGTKLGDRLRITDVNSPWTFGHVGTVTKNEPQQITITLDSGRKVVRGCLGIERVPTITVEEMAAILSSISMLPDGCLWRQHLESLKEKIIEAKL